MFVKSVSVNVLVQVKTLVCVNVKIVVKIILVASRMLVVVNEKESINTFLFFKINIIKYLFTINLAKYMGLL